MESANTAEVLSLFFGPKSNAIGASLFALEAGQMFELDDPIEHSVFFRDPAKKIPRALFFEDSSNFELLGFLNSVKMDTSKELSSLWNPSKVKVYNQKPEETEEKSLKNLIFSKFSIPTSRLLPLPNFYTSKFVDFFQGNEAIQANDHAENIREITRKSLEESDHIGGFQIVSDCDSGFGIYSHFVLETLKEEAEKTPVVMVPIHETRQETKKQRQIQTLNRMFTLSYFKECDFILPIDFSMVVEELGRNFNLDSDSDLYDLSLGVSVLLSNATLGFRLKEERDSLRNFLEKLKFFPTMNIFNLAATVPFIDEKGAISSNNIFEYKGKSSGISCFNSFSNPRKTHFEKGFQSFSEGFVLRGLCQEKFIGKPNSYQFTIKGIEALMSFDDQRVKVGLNKEVAKQYEEDAWPLHSCLFTNDKMRDGIKELLEEFKEIDMDLKKNFIEEEDFSNDTFKEMLNSLSCIGDNYDKKN